MSNSLDKIKSNLHTVRNSLIGGITGLGVGTICGGIVGFATGGVIGGIGGGALGLVLSGPYGAYAIGELGAQSGAMLGIAVGAGSLGVAAATIGVERGYNLNKPKIQQAKGIKPNDIPRVKELSLVKDKTPEIELGNLKGYGIPNTDDKIKSIVQQDISKINTQTHDKLKIQPVSQYQSVKNGTKKDNNPTLDFSKNNK